MRQTKRKFVALSTALAMALVLVASLVPSFGAKAAPATMIENIDFSFSKPEAGTTITIEEYMPNIIPDVSTTTEGIKSEGQGVDKQPGGRFVTDDSTIDNYTNFEGTLESGKTYKAFIYANASDGYQISDNASVTITNATVLDKKVENEDLGEFGSISAVYLLISFTVGSEPTPAPDPDPTPTPSSEVPTISDGSTVEVAPAEDGTVTFRFEKDLEYFENGGQLFIDGQEVPTDMYKATRGSTIITLFKEYAAKLADGAEHAVKVVFNNGETVEGKLVVKAASSDSSASTAANGTSGTASSTAATTTKVTSPKTADVLPIAGIALVFVGASAIGVIAYRRKNL